ncbi:MAG TPA: hypothetical protein VFV94_16210 [Polyangiaceae bacterium]|nr:hypothetical protein [Polyangiaceae bacterium]
MSRALRRKPLASALVLLACAGQHLDVGNDPPAEDTGVSGTGGGSGGTGAVMVGNGGSQLSGGGTAGTPPPSIEWPSQTGCDTDPAYQDLLGTWQGQLEDFYLQRIRPLTLVINGASSHGMCGSLKWGDGEAPPPATDPSAAYPSPNVYDVMGYGGSPGYSPLDGVTYTIVQGAVRDRSVRLSIGPRELWRSWCELQTSYPIEVGYSCLPYSDVGYSWGPEPDGICTAGKRSFSNFACFICLAGVCECDERSCTASTSDHLELALTLSSDGRVLTGPADDRATGGYIESGAAYYFEHVQ